MSERAELCDRDEDAALAAGVSVVVTTFDRPESAASLVHQLFAQRHVAGPMEILVVNDNGTTDVFDRLAHVRGGPVPLRFFDTGYSGYGPALARNAGLRFARYDTIVFLDDDVTIGAELIACYQKAPPGVRLGRVDFAVQTDGQRDIVPDRRTVLMNGEDRLVSPFREFLFYLWSANFCIATAAGRMLGGFDEEFLDEGQEDSDFGARLIFATGRLVAVPSARAIHDGPDVRLKRLLGLPGGARPERAAERLRSRRSFAVNGGPSYWRDPKWTAMVR